MELSFAPIRRWPLAVGRWTFSSLLPPRFPASLQNPDLVRQLRFVPQTPGDIFRQVAARGAAINDNLFLRRPIFREKLREHFAPAILIQRDRSRNMIALEFLRRPRIDPDDIRAPAARR